MCSEERCDSDPHAQTRSGLRRGQLLHERQTGLELHGDAAQKDNGLCLRI